MISYSKAIYLLLLLGNKISLSHEQSSRYNECSQFLETQRKDRYKEIMSRFLPVITCLTCSETLCHFHVSQCDKSSEVASIPLYENILEFGLVGENHPVRAIATTNLSNNCTLDVRISNAYRSNFTLVQIYECLHKIYCTPISYKYRVKTSWYNSCFQFGMIFKDKRKLYFAISTSCYEVATAGFEKTLFINLRECEIQNATELSTHWKFWQDNRRNLDGVPLALPCLAGGYLFDQFSGRILSGVKCEYHLTYLNHTDPDIGLDFVFKKVFNSNVDLLFPFEKPEASTSREGLLLRIRPLYIIKNHSTNTWARESRKSMKPKIVKNPDYINKVHFGCYKLNRKPDDQVIREKCEDVISELRDAPQEILIEEEETNAYLPSEVACFFCLPVSKDVASITLPLYLKTLEFGFVGEFFPENATIVIFYAKVCQLKVVIYSENVYIYIKLYECSNFEDECTQLNTTNNRGPFQHNNVFCVHVSLYFHDRKKVYYSFGFRCWQYGNFRIWKFVTLTKKDCGEEGVIMWSYFKVIPHLHSLVEGIPLILPCSSGGYVINSETGRYVAGKACDKSYWDSLRRMGVPRDTDFVLKFIHNNSRFLLFPKRNKRIPYPRPIYMGNDGMALPPDLARPKVVNEDELEKAEGLECDLINRELGNIGTTERKIIFAETTAPAVSVLGTTTASGGYSLSALEIPEYIFYFMLLILMKIF